MELELLRTYFPNGTSGVLRQCNNKNGILRQAQNDILCYTIELPWLDNRHGVSCIPEGKYELVKRYSKKFGEHLLLQGVANRSLILVHPANDAQKELKGCIAPVSILTGEGKGLRSRIAFKMMYSLVINSVSQHIPVFLTIKS